MSAGYRFSIHWRDIGHAHILRAMHVCAREISRALLQSDRQDTPEFVTTRRKYAITDIYQLYITQL